MNYPSFLSLPQVARRLGLSVEWLRDEIEAGRIPHLKTGRRIMLNVETVERVLLARANENTLTMEVAHAS